MICKSFHHIEKNKIALCELTEIPISFVADVIENPKGAWVYFNRLNTPPAIRGKGIAKKLLTEMIKWADTKKISIYLDINPYGNLNLKQLIALYERFGFTKIKHQTMVRRNDVCPKTD
jgi:GNAT superfamily N-acetyltransferase